MARKFFYIAAGMFLLALSYHLGASNARAQAGGSLVGAFVVQGFSPWLAVAVDDAGHLYARTQGGGWTAAAQLPGTPTALLPAVNTVRRSEDAACGSAGPELIRAGSTLEAMGGMSLNCSRRCGRRG
jgi:hypothetical protein